MSRIESFEFQGCRFSYRIDGSGPPLVGIMGVGAEGSVLNPQTKQFAERHACLSFDNRGIGNSLPAGRALSAEQMAADTVALMDHLGWGAAHIVGHSFGGLIALEVALANKARVRSLNLLCSFANGMEATRMTPRLLWIVARLGFAWHRARRNAFMELALPPGYSGMYSPAVADQLSEIVGHDIAEEPPITREQVKALRRTDLTSRLGELAGIPTLVINGDQDLIARPALGRAAAAGIPGARYIEIAGAAHSFPVLEPERCAGLVLEHLAKVDEATPEA